MAKEISLKLPDGSKLAVPEGTTGMQAAERIGKRLAGAAIAVRNNGILQDTSATLKPGDFAIVTYDCAEGREIFGHTSAHVLAYAISELFPKAKNTIGPAVEEGFYYDFDELGITPEDFEAIEKKMREIIKKDEPIKRIELTLAEAKKLFAGNKYKLEMIEELAKEGKLSAYKIGDKFTDLCKGPHLPRLSMLGAIKLMKLAGAFWRGDAKNKQLTRVYGVSFPTNNELEAHLKLLEEAAKRDHRKLGSELELFMFHEWSPGSPFILPKGTIIYNELQKFIREEYRKRSYQEVITPQMFNKALWELSGHWNHFKENMFCLEVDGQEFALKPMNCPSHVLIFKNKARSYRDLPWRIADFCMLHRNEVRGTLGGMTRVRKMSQDDSHIFCTPEQIESEIFGVLDFVKNVYDKVFRLEIVVKLSTKPDNAMGEPALWEKAEAALAVALKKAGLKYEIKESDDGPTSPDASAHLVVNKADGGTISIACLAANRAKWSRMRADRATPPMSCSGQSQASTAPCASALNRTVSTGFSWSGAALPRPKFLPSAIFKKTTSVVSTFS
jgi:threonyl-tRNA synthetase